MPSQFCGVARGDTHTLSPFFPFSRSVSGKGVSSVLSVILLVKINVMASHTEPSHAGSSIRSSCAFFCILGVRRDKDKRLHVCFFLF